MKRVLYICNEDRRMGGSSRSLEDMLEVLGREVDPILLFREDSLVSNHFRSLGYRCLVVPFYRATYTAKGPRVIVHAIAREITQRRCVRAVKASLKDMPVDLVHSNSSTVDIGLRIASALGVPHVWHIREYPMTPDGKGLRFFPSYSAWLRKLRSSDKVIAISPGLYDYLGLSAPQGWCIPDTVKVGGSNSAKTVIPKPYVLFMAAVISELKRPLEALEIFAGASLGEDVRMAFVGSADGKVRDEIVEKAGKLGIGNRLAFVPFVTDVGPVLSGASALLVCTAYEGLGRATVEAMLCCCPVIARNSGGSADVLGEGKYGFLYDNVESASKALAGIVGNRPEDLIDLAWDHARQTFSPQAFSKAIMTVYDE